MSISGTDRIHETYTKLSLDPSAGKTTPTVVAELANGHARLSSGLFNWDADLGPAIGGGNLAPSPTQYLLGALAGCAVVFLADTLAPQFGVALDRVRATARCIADTGGLLGVAGSRAALEQIEVEVSVGSAEPSERLEALFGAWRERCPIYLALLQPNDVTVSFAVEAGQAAREGGGSC